MPCALLAQAPAAPAPAPAPAAAAVHGGGPHVGAWAAPANAPCLVLAADCAARCAALTAHGRWCARCSCPCRLPRHLLTAARCEAGWVHRLG
eukprot:1161547-Pelagomonas_calceolata.AAC.1